jgi:heme/copper-type cytochrome/quinol oxidase subunit 1
VRRLLALWTLPIVGVVSLVVGVLLITKKEPASFGWFAYAPLSNEAFTPMSPFNVAGLIVVVAGLILIAGWVGFQLGSRKVKRA